MAVKTGVSCEPRWPDSRPSEYYIRSLIDDQDAEIVRSKLRSHFGSLSRRLWLLEVCYLLERLDTYIGPLL